ncbi:MAG: hypothetical protein Q4D48_02075, partial [Coriobacteriales bacterium]|nr:hypothetical protein [Coriobacteriales bacterium]
ESVSNADDHTLEVVVKDVASTSPMFFELWVEGESVSRASASATIDASARTASAVFDAPFLMKEGDQATVAENTFSPAPMSVTDTGGQRGTYPGVKPILPDTSDSSTSGGLEMGLATAGAAILAYERRRAHNERLEGAASDKQ